jgi:hypothetical protein
MNCSEAKELVQLYLDEELSARDTLDVQRHLKACPSCTSLLDYFARQDDTLRQIAKAETVNSSPLRDKIWQAIEEEKRAPEKSRWRTLLRNSTLRRVAAVLILAAIAAIMLLRGLTPFINDKVYADAVRDHSIHCLPDNLPKTVSDPSKINQMVAAYSHLQQAPDLSAFGYTQPRAAICTLNKIKTLHLIYLKGDEKPLSIFLKLHDTRFIADELISLTRSDYRLTSRVEQGTDMVMVSNEEEQQAAAIAKAILSQQRE